jgi:hypothetical protein
VRGRSRGRQDDGDGEVKGEEREVGNEARKDATLDPAVTELATAACTDIMLPLAGKVVVASGGEVPASESW